MTIVRVIDGDTVIVRVSLGFNTYIETPIRLAGINAPELSTDEGKRVRDALIAEVARVGSGRFVARSYKSGQDKYGRWLADIWSTEKDSDHPHLNSWMIDQGYAQPWDGKGVKP